MSHYSAYGSSIDRRPTIRPAGCAGAAVRCSHTDVCSAWVLAPASPSGRLVGRFSVAGLVAALAGLATLLGVVPCYAGGEPRGASRVQGLRVSEAGGDTSVVIAASEKPTFTTWKLERPTRVVVEVSGARLGDVEVPFDAGTYALGSVSASTVEDESGSRTRVVLTLRQPSDYQVASRGNDILVRIVPTVRPAPRGPVADARETVRAQEEARRLAEERARAEEARRLAEERVRTEEVRRGADAALKAAAAETRRLTEARTSADETARRLAGELAGQKARAEQARKEAAEARTSADETARRLARELAGHKAQAEQARKEAEEARSAARAERERTLRALAEARAAQEKAEERLRSSSREEANRMREELGAARRETDRLRAEAERQREALARSEAAWRKTQHEAAAQLDQRQKMAETKAAKAAETTAKMLAAIASQTASQEEQRVRLERAERTVAEREAKVQTAQVAVAERERASALAEARLRALDKAEPSTEARQKAEREAADADRQRREAVAEAERSRGALAVAVTARKEEETRRAEIERERMEQERRLNEAVAARAGEEERRRIVEQERRKEEQRLVDAQSSREKLEADRKKLQADHDALVAELARLRKAPAAAKTAPQSAPAVLATRPTVPSAAEAPAQVRPRSITLRVPSRVQRVDFVDEPTRSSVIIDLDEPSAFAVERTGGRRLTLRLLHADLPRGLEQSLDATEYLGPVRVISTYPDPGARGSVRVDVDLADDVPNKVRQDGGRLYWDFQKSRKLNMGTLGGFRKPGLGVLFQPGRKVAGFRAMVAGPLAAGIAQAPGAPAAGSFRPGGTNKKRYTGRRIDLDFKSADIHNILRLLADVGQVNIVTSDDVRGEVTIKMRDVPWDQALDVVLRGKQLGAVREGNLIRVAPLTVLEKELEQEIARQKQINDVLPTETRLIGVSYAEATILQEKARDLLSPRGKISVDARTNNMIVSDVTKNLALIEELVRNLDTQTSQVVIEARIIEARSTFVRQFGIQWGGTAFADVDHGNPTGIVFPYNIGIGGGATDGQTPLEGLVARPRSGYGAANPNFAVNLPVAAGTGAGGALGLTLGSVAGAFNLNLRLSALETSGQIRILSSPRITTMDNIEASIEQGVAIPISVVSAQGVQTQFVDAKLNLTVKPHVTNEGTVTMSIAVTRNEPDFANTGARGDPTILKKEAKTTMLVRDGDTAVIGGIYTRNSGLNYAKLPFFADLPILGVLFRNRRENDDRTEFLVFITPRIANRARALGQ